jgi:hypothetical protein
MSASATTIVFSDNFDDGDVSDWVKTDNSGGSVNSFVTTTTALPSGSGLAMLVGFNAPPGGSNVEVRATNTFNAPVAGDYDLDMLASNRVCSGCVMSYDVLLNGSSLGRFQAASNTNVFAHHIDLNGLTAGTHTITLGFHTTGASSGGFTATFDNVEISTHESVVPVPGALVGGLTAIGALAAMAGRRRKAA